MNVIHATVRCVQAILLIRLHNVPPDAQRKRKGDNGHVEVVDGFEK
jgi:hypothetical protein